MATQTSTLKMDRLKMGWRKRAFPAMAGVVTLLTFALWLFLSPLALSNFGDQLFDEFQRQNPREYVDMGVRVVEIDDESLARYGQWPWPRPLIGELAKNAVDAGAGLVAFDMVFAEADRTSPENLAEVLGTSGASPAVLNELATMPSHDSALAEVFAELPVILGFFGEGPANADSETPFGCAARRTFDEANPDGPAFYDGISFLGDDMSDALPAYSGSTQSLPDLSAAAAGAGLLSVVPKEQGEDRYVRVAPLLARINGAICPSLSLSALNYIFGGRDLRDGTSAATGIQIVTTTKSREFGSASSEVVGMRLGTLLVPTTEYGEVYMNYTSDFHQRVVPAWKLLDPSVSVAERRELFDGTVVFVGASAQGLRDLVATPLHAQMAGVHVHAQVVEMVIADAVGDAGVFLQRPDWSAGVRFATMVLGGLVLILIIPITPPLISGLLGGVLVGGMLFGSYFLHTDRSLLFDPIFPIVGLTAVYGMTSLFSFVVANAEKSHIKGAFDRYLSPELVDKIADDPSLLNLGGEDRDMTILFSDIRNFSSLAEGMSPAEVTNYLNRYLTPMTDILMARKATVDKYIGDSIMSFWNAPLDDDDQYKNAARAALEMTRKLNTMNATVGTDLVGEGDSLPVTTQIGIGLQSGPTSVGNMGSEQRFAYSVVGDVVNTASRLEGMTKQYGLSILVGDTLAAQLQEFALIEVDRVKAVGKDVDVTIFALIGEEETAVDPAFDQLKETHAEFLAKYRSQDFDDALVVADELAILGDRFGLRDHYAIMKDRIEHFRINPPPKDWDGVFVLQEK